jgi:peptidyl-prolyl cis-trans isomerase C
MKRRTTLVYAVLLSSVLWAEQAAAQAAPPPDPSPLAPGDLKRPVFDTQTPVYDTTGKQAKSASTVVAEVDGRSVTLGDVADAIRDLPSSVSALPFEELYPGILAQLVRQQALVIRAQQQALDEDPAVRRRVKAAADRVMANELLNREITGTITEQALLDRYNKEIAGKPGPEEVRVRVIMVPTEEQAMAVIGELRGGADFATVAKRVSKDTTAQVGGDLGFQQLNGMTAEIGAVAFALTPGQFAPYPVRSAGAWFVVKTEDRRRQPPPSFAEARAQLTQEMLREGVPEVVTKALAQATVREYDINGKEASK